MLNYYVLYAITLTYSIHNPRGVPPPFSLERKENVKKGRTYILGCDRIYMYLCSCGDNIVIKSLFCHLSMWGFNLLICGCMSTTFIISVNYKYIYIYICTYCLLLQICNVCYKSKMCLRRFSYWQTRFMLMESLYKSYILK